MSSALFVFKLSRRLHSHRAPQHLLKTRPDVAQAAWCQLTGVSECRYHVASLVRRRVIPQSRFHLQCRGPGMRVWCSFSTHISSRLVPATWLEHLSDGLRFLEATGQGDRVSLILGSASVPVPTVPFARNQATRTAEHLPFFAFACSSSHPL